MNKIEKLSLIEGNFSCDEAKEILANIFLTKIHFHEKKSFSSQVRFGKEDEIALKRIPDLKNEMDKLFQIILDAKSNNKKLIITSEINISLIDN